MLKFLFRRKPRYGSYTDHLPKRDGWPITRTQPKSGDLELINGNRELYRHG